MFWAFLGVSHLLARLKAKLLTPEIAFAGVLFQDGKMSFSANVNTFWHSRILAEIELSKSTNATALDLKELSAAEQMETPLFGMDAAQ